MDWKIFLDIFDRKLKEKTLYLGLMYVLGKY